MITSTRPVVSVVMPAYNAETSIADAIHSIYDQTFQDFEIIVVDDGSRDGTPGIVASLQDARLIPYRNGINLGVAASFNTGLSMARGEFIARMDADDIAMPDRLAVQCEFLRSRPNVTVCGAGMILFGDGSGTASAPTEDANIKARFMAGMGNIFNPTAFFRRQFAIDHGIHCHSGHPIGEDLAFWIECMRHGAVFANINFPLVRYRLRSRHSSYRNDAAMRRILSDLASDFFPLLTAHEANALTNIFVTMPGEVATDEVGRITAACEKAAVDDRSYFGENRQHLREIITLYLSAFLQKVGTCGRDGSRNP